MGFKFNPFTGNFDIDTNFDLDNPLQFKGDISVNTDFPLIASVQSGWFYTVSASVTDDAGVTYTNTGLSFVDGDEIAWNGSTWVLVGNKAIALVDLTDVDDAAKAEGKILKVDSAGTHVYVTDESGTDEKVKYDVNDPTAGYLADKFIAGSGISLAEGTDANENKLVITNNDKGSDVDLSGYWKSDGSSTATGDWYLGAYDLTTTNLTLNENVYLLDTDDSTGAVGIIYKAGVPFIHNYHKLFAVNGTTPLDGQNLFIGKDAGNFTMGAEATATEQSSNNLGIGKEALKSLTTGYDNIAIGALSSSAITTGRGNVYIGGNAGASTSALSFNVGIGQDSVKSAISAGGNLVGVGYETLMNVKNGGPFTALGTSAGRTITTGSHGSFIGYKAGYYARGDASTFIGSEAGLGGSSTSSNGTFNTAVGYQAFRSYTSGQRNAMLGQASGYSISSGQRNTGVGSEVLYGLKTGSYNTAIGEGAGRYYSTGTSAHTTGNYSVFLGRLTRPLANGQTNQIVIGNDAVGFGSNTATIGNSSQTDAYIMGNIRTLSDTYKHYFGAGNDASIYYNGTNLVINPKEVGSGYLSVLGDIDAGANTIRTTGDVKGIHKTADGTTAVADGTYTVGIGGTTNGTITIKDGIITAVQEAVA